ncbi:MAG: phosphoenolpyruvate--protein phosphotransferase [Omnitrophica WOR_2 bacterium RIFCSPLOWO2_02_FULL_63_16]|nr:MAG: phosphoenolpyruvate--protein phosphotransferase [Omnitrophica WOR_2 bacterium GWA2_63_20]OGX17185.1 MAG: phosphoenolpyruvate--protein phosphotransferase [Omnitrophica WOR_2 bacterium GWF2_63_9]OGX31360.1 MAG: phosphoenolpyruvate--protein phosphotransferase [Omnitrophica WOR_2 bacterium RIFCSPHIGHO2_12_FULL_64_13]OGX34684.1 MAG: phosphoenolpyruvate--protein phosphotransferase [Omnitrophica WOR_2 bacterium RIFCSPHIGHO2_02_FULL_63_39]OGX44651.1 MAG: phosphoenolpyruvate--protein phosphotran
MLVLKGIPASSGVAIGKAFLFSSEELLIPRRPIAEAEIPAEVMRFEEALIQTRHQILGIQHRLADEMGQEHAEIFNAHLLVLEDQSLREEVLGGLKAQRLNVEYIFNEVVRRYLRAFARTNDEYLRDRTADIEDVRKRILRNLTGRHLDAMGQLDEPVVVIAHALSPSETALMHKRHVLAFVTDVGGRTGHTAIMAKSLGIPAVVGVEVATARIEKEGLIIVDGTRGEVIVDPDPATIRRYEVEQRRIQEVNRQLLQLKDLPAETLDGHRVTLSANIEVPDEIPSVIAHGAEGIGLYRTEFFYLNRTDFPSEEEQFQSYKSVAERLAPQSVIIRTVDLGGDKFLSPLDLPTEMNPFMGWRAIRFCLARPDVFRVQLRAILRASAYGNLKLMFPMISGLEELRRAHEILEGVKGELTREGLAFSPAMDVGAMIEVPSAALTCDLLAGDAKFFSIGTNDLIQYALAVDRVNEKIAYLYEPAHPAVLRLLKQILDAGHQAGIWVGMCGEMAGEPALALLLLGLGLDEFSVSPIQVPLIKKVIRAVEYHTAQAIAQQAMQFRTGKEVEAFLLSHLRQLVPDLAE